MTPAAPALVLLGFLGSATLVVLAGVWLARSGDVIAARTRLGGLWVGSIFLAVATSLPELTTDISAVRIGAPDLAAGDLFGSSMANMLILALVSLLPGAELFHRAALDNGIAAALAIGLTATAAVFLLVRFPFAVAGVGVGSLVLAAAYLAGIRAVFRKSLLARKAGMVTEMASEAQVTEAAPAELLEEAMSLRGAVARFVLAAAVILVAAPLFASSAAGLAALTGLSTTFVGTWLVGLATSLPELVTSLAAVRMRAYDLAVGNLFGSNAVNMVMFLPLDVVHHGPFLASISPVHAISALVGIVLMAIGLAGIVYRSSRRLARLEPIGAVMLIAYVTGLVLIYVRSTAP